MERKYFKELARRLQIDEIDTAPPESKRLVVLLKDQPVLFVSAGSDVFQLPAGSNNPDASDLYHKVAQTADEVYAYCNRVCDEKGRTCKEVGANLTWTKSRGADEVFKEYRREYKKRFAWIKAGKIVAEDFYAWGEKARKKMSECEDGKLSLEAFSSWLKQS